MILDIDYIIERSFVIGDIYTLICPSKSTSILGSGYCEISSKLRGRRPMLLLLLLLFFGFGFLGSIGQFM